MSLLEQLGERVKCLKEEFPYGVNVSLYEVLSPRSIFVATYERGAGITLSCGTAMTASATAAAMLGYTESGERTAVTNRGGRVFCTPRIEESGIVTRLEGNATFEWWGEASFEGGVLSFAKLRDSGEQEVWLRFVSEINR
jgi:diaminopimelate epimerase